MACFKPLQAYRLGSGDIVFHDRGDGRSIELPCGQCIGCRLEKSRTWALRIMNEAQMHEENSFITLTYAPEFLPPDCGLRKRDLQLFFKRLRKFYSHKKIRFYACGEYGDTTNRPHYHAILFNHQFNDLQYLFNSDSGSPVYTSEELSKIWGKGFVTVGECTFESAAYCARYVVKKINGDMADIINEETGLKHYERINAFTGEVCKVLPEFSTMSRRPGIGRDWISTYTSDVYPKDFTTVRGHKVRPPRYYDDYLKQTNSELYDQIKAIRELNAYNSSDENTESRLSQREKVKEAQNSKLKRSI